MSKKTKFTTKLAKIGRIIKNMIQLYIMYKIQCNMQTGNRGESRFPTQHGSIEWLGIPSHLKTT